MVKLMFSNFISSFLFQLLICKQVIREHDEFAGRRGCRINAQPISNGGFMIWFTIPAR